VNNSELNSEIQLLEKAVMMVGQEDVRDLLWAYTDVSLKYEELQKDYNELLSKYNALLSQTP